MREVDPAPFDSAVPPAPGLVERVTLGLAQASLFLAAAAWPWADGAPGTPATQALRVGLLLILLALPARRGYWVAGWMGRATRRGGRTAAGDATVVLAAVFWGWLWLTPAPTRSRTPSPDPATAEEVVAPR